VVENYRSGDRVAMILFLRGFHSRPLKKGQEIVFGDLEKIVSVTGLAESGYQSHAQQVPPETNGLVHITRYHSQVINAIELDHDSSGMSVVPPKADP
jgi:hypothetical protein